MTLQKVPVTFTYQKDGIDPPVYIAGSFSDPPWQPQEMAASTDQHGGHIFTKQVMVEDGSEIQYKFRLGSGNWWALDETADKIRRKVTDDVGNTNNILRVSVEKSRETNAKAPNPRVRELKGPGPSSGAQTPDIAETAAEVADSARIVDPETPEPDISDSEAGRIGIRRLSNTPIGQVADTSMEVAAVAATLDVEESDSTDETSSDGDLCPVFSHEFMGPPCHDEEAPDDSDVGNYVENKTTSQNSEPTSDNEDLDFDDPQLEPFPSTDRDSIIAAVRRISTSIDADRTVVDEVPPSPLLTILKQQGGVDSTEGSSVAADSMENPPRNDEDNTAGLSSLTDPGTRATSISPLGSIAEDDDESPNKTTVIGTERSPNQFIQHFGPAVKRESTVDRNTSDDDEGIAMSNESKRATREFPYNPEAQPFEPAMTSTDNIPEIKKPNSDEVTPVSTDQANITALGDSCPIDTERDTSKDNSDIAARRIPDACKSDSPNKTSSDEGEARSTSVDPSNQQNLRKRTADKQATPPSGHYIHDSGKHSNWFEACIRVVFVRWLGGFAAWLYSRRHKALMAAGTAVIVVGVGLLWQSPIRQ
ncbi:hypothetical protein AAE478_003807 [Parahypoxylon ruwenzoriense]